MARSKEDYAREVRELTQKALAEPKTFQSLADQWIETGLAVEVDSTNVKAIRYLKETQELQVQFLGTAKGKREPWYYYDAVPEATARAFFTARSYGKFHAWAIKHNFHCSGPH